MCKSFTSLLKLISRCFVPLDVIVDKWDDVENWNSKTDHSSFLTQVIRNTEDSDASDNLSTGPRNFVWNLGELDLGGARPLYGRLVFFLRFQGLPRRGIIGGDGSLGMFCST